MGVRAPFGGDRMGVRRGVGGTGLAGRLRRCVLAICVAVCGLAAPPAAAGETDGPLAYHASVHNGSITGSAFAVADGIAVTNAHVVRGRAPGATVKLVASAPQGASVMGLILAVSPRMDLAVLRVPKGFLPAVTGLSARSGAGARVVAAGIDASGGRSSGARLAIAGQVTVPSLDVPQFGPGLVARIPGVRPGFSGGPVLDGHGRLVGMLAAIRGGSVPAQTASGFAPRGAPAVRAEEAYVLRAADVTSEIRRLLAANR